MKTTTALVALGLSAITEAKPIARRADASEAASVGYATQNGGTTGGAGGESTTVSTLDALMECADQDVAAICIVDGTIEGAEAVRVSSDTTIIGKDSNAILQGVGFKINGKADDKVKNVIIRNLSIDKVLADTGDAIGMQYVENVWVDHCDLQGDRTQDDKDLYDGLFDVTHGSDYVTLTNTFMHNHWKGSLVGHSDSNADEDTGHLTVTYANNYFYDLNSRAPSFRFGTGHIFNNYFENVSDGINSRLGAQLLVEGNTFVDVGKPLYAVDDDGFAVDNDNDFGSGENTAPAGDMAAMPYEYTLLASSEVKAAVVGTAESLPRRTTADGQTQTDELSGPLPAGTSVSVQTEASLLAPEPSGRKGRPRPLEPRTAISAVETQELKRRDPGGLIPLWCPRTLPDGRERAELSEVVDKPSSRRLDRGAGIGVQELQLWKTTMICLNATPLQLLTYGLKPDQGSYVSDGSILLDPDFCEPLERICAHPIYKLRHVL